MKMEVGQHEVVEIVTAAHRLALHPRVRAVAILGADELLALERRGVVEHGADARAQLRDRLLGVGMDRRLATRELGDRELHGVARRLDLATERVLIGREARNEQNVYVEVEVPGLCRDDLEVVVHQGVLRIWGERKATEDSRNYWYNERSFGRFERLITLPDVVDSETIDAEMHDGILSVKLMKRPEAQPKKVAIKAG